MYKYLLTTLLLFLFFIIFTSSSYAHSEAGVVGKYIVSFTQEPLSPFVGEKVKVTLRVTDKNDQPVPNLKGQLLIKQLEVTQYKEALAKQEYKILYQTQSQTETDGTTSIEYTFNKEAVYDVEFVWGKDEENESTGLQLMPRTPTSYFAVSEALPRIGFFMGLVTVGGIIGSICTFILLTATLHPKK